MSGPGAPATVGANTVVVDVATTDAQRISAVLQALGPYLGSGVVSTAANAGSLGQTGTSISVVFDAPGWIEGVAIVAASVASDHVPGASAAWAGADGLVRTTSPSPWFTTA